MNGNPSIVAVVTAGQSPDQEDPLAEYTQGMPKALIPIVGRPMIAYVIDALAGSAYIEHIVVVALGPTADAQLPVPVEHVPDAGGILSNTEAGIQHAVTHYDGLDAILLSTSDVPTITEHDLYYGIVRRSVMEARFPESRRTYVHLRDGDVAGGDVILIRPGLAVNSRDLVRDLSEARKSPLRQARMFGLWPLLKLIARRLSLAEAERRACHMLGVNGRAVPFPYAEVAMDVDKPFQLEIARAELEKRAAQHA
jgi:hypothetical protein